MDYLDWFPVRLAELRGQKNVSARDMSLSLGQSESYINKIENRHIRWPGFSISATIWGLLPRSFLTWRSNHPGERGRRRRHSGA